MAKLSFNNLKDIHQLGSIYAQLGGMYQNYLSEDWGYILINYQPIPDLCKLVKGKMQTCGLSGEFHGMLGALGVVASEATQLVELKEKIKKNKDGTTAKLLLEFEQKKNKLFDYFRIAKQLVEAVDAKYTAVLSEQEKLN
jgi:hypothetical protein